MDLAIDKELSIVRVQKTFDMYQPLPNLKVYECFSEATEAYTPVIMETSEGAYSTRLSLPMNILEDKNALHYLCSFLSSHFVCNVWCSDELYSLDSSPYWSTIYVKGVAYLTDDSKFELDSCITEDSFKILEKIPKDKLPESVKEYAQK